jgi:hypothetical protein
MNEMIIEEIKNYEFGFTTFFEMVTQIANIDCKEGRIIAEQVEKIRESEEYHDYLRAFHRNVAGLFKENREIDAIVGYYQVMANED